MTDPEIKALISAAGVSSFVGVVIAWAVLTTATKISQQVRRRHYLRHLDRDLQNDPAFARFVSVYRRAKRYVEEGDDGLLVERERLAEYLTQEVNHFHRAVKLFRQTRPSTVYSFDAFMRDRDRIERMKSITFRAGTMEPWISAEAEDAMLTGVAGEGRPGPYWNYLPRRSPPAAGAAAPTRSEHDGGPMGTSAAATPAEPAARPAQQPASEASEREGLRDRSDKDSSPS